MPDHNLHINAILQEIGELAGAYHRLLLMVARKTAAASGLIAETAAHLGGPVTNLNAELSSALLDVPHRQRQLKAHKVVGDIVDGVVGDLVLFDHIDILFSPSLQLDALALLKSLSRNKTVVATWHGNIKSGRVQHAEEWHPEYQSHPVDDIKAITVDATQHRDGWQHFGGAFDA